MEPTNSAPNTRNKKDPAGELAAGPDTTGIVSPETIDTWMATDHADGSTTVTGSSRIKVKSFDLSVLGMKHVRFELIVRGAFSSENFANTIDVLIEAIEGTFVFSLKQITFNHPPLRALSRLTDWVPFPGVRKRQRKLLADEQAEIAQFRAEGRIALARWRSAWAWVHWVHYLISAPFAAAVSMIRGKAGI